MSPADITYRVVAALDFSDDSYRALEAAIAAVRRRDRGELHIVSVVDDHGGGLPFLARHVPLGEATDRVRQKLVAVATERLGRVRGHDGEVAPSTVVHVRVGSVPEQIASLATEIAADLVVVGTHGTRGFRKLLLGSAAERTVRMAPCPVLVVRPKDVSVMEKVPKPEPPCPACVEIRKETHNTRWWCDDHTQERPQLHVYSYSSPLDPREPTNHLL